MGDDERRRIGVATYYVKNEKEAEEAHLLARLAGYSRFAHLVFEVAHTAETESPDCVCPAICGIGSFEISPVTCGGLVHYLLLLWIHYKSSKSGSLAG